MAEDVDREDKTEEATPRRRTEAREKGQVAMSGEILVALGLCTGGGALLFGGAWVGSSAGEMLEHSLATVGTRGAEELSIDASVATLSASFEPLVAPVLAVIVPMLAVAFLAGYGQVGFQVTPKAVAWDLARLDPVKGWSRIFAKRSLVRTLLALLKIVVISATVGVLAWGRIGSIAALVGSDLGPMLAGLGDVVMRCGLAALVAILGIAAIDFGFQRWQHESDLRMTKREVKDEARNSEGDPHVKSRIRAVQREMARRRMMSDVPKATVVVTNPTHYAVALRYDREPEAAGRRPRAPLVVAKGADHVARKIKEVAREADVPCYEDVALARALHAQVEIGDEIPATLYQAVASVLAYVYRLKPDEARA